MDNRLPGGVFCIFCITQSDINQEACVEEGGGGGCEAVRVDLVLGS